MNLIFPPPPYRPNLLTALKRSLFTCFLALFGVFTNAFAAQDGRIQILGVGNSFTVNSTKFLPEIIAADPAVQADVAGAIIGGSSLENTLNAFKNTPRTPIPERPTTTGSTA